MTDEIAKLSDGLVFQPTMDLRIREQAMELIVDDSAASLLRRRILQQRWFAYEVDPVLRVVTGTIEEWRDVPVVKE